MIPKFLILILNLVTFSLYVPNIYRMVKHDSQKDYQMLTKPSTRLSVLSYLFCLIYVALTGNIFITIASTLALFLPVPTAFLVLRYQKKMPK